MKEVLQRLETASELEKQGKKAESAAAMEDIEGWLRGKLSDDEAQS